MRAQQNRTCQVIPMKTKMLVRIRDKYPKEDIKKPGTGGWELVVVAQANVTSQPMLFVKKPLRFD